MGPLRLDYQPGLSDMVDLLKVVPLLSLSVGVLARASEGHVNDCPVWSVHEVFFLVRLL
jgi:hypothetical protein